MKFSDVAFPLNICTKFAFVSSLFLSACTLPHSGPSLSNVLDNGDEKNNKSPIPVVMIDSTVTKILNQNENSSTFVDVFGDLKPNVYKVNYGDSIDLLIWESAPSLLFGGNKLSSDDFSVTSEKLPTQVVEEDGKIFIPFLGTVSVVGKTARQIEESLIKALSGKANNPQVLVQVTNRPTDQVTVIGDVNSSKNISLTPKGERVLDAVALASGINQSYNKITISLSRDGKTVDLPLERIIREPEQNIYLNAKDVVVAMYQPWSYTVMGAANKNQEFNLEATGISLIEALARAGGINDNMADPRGIFVFRFEDQSTYKNLLDQFVKGSGDQNEKAVGSHDPKINENWQLANLQGKMPIIYEIDFNEPESFFKSQNFKVKNRDVIFIASASGYELTKFLRMLGLIVNPALSWGNTINNMTD